MDSMPSSAPSEPSSLGLELELSRPDRGAVTFRLFRRFATARLTAGVNVGATMPSAVGSAFKRSSASMIRNIFNPLAFRFRQAPYVFRCCLLL